MYFCGMDAGVSSDALGRATTEFVAGTCPIVAAWRILVVGAGDFVLGAFEFGLNIESDLAGIPWQPVSVDRLAHSRLGLDFELLEFTPRIAATFGRWEKSFAGGRQSNRHLVYSGSTRILKRELDRSQNDARTSTQVSSA